MALANFSLPFGALAQPWGATLAPLHPIHQLASNTNNLLYSPADHQQPQSPADAAPDYYKNNPYAAPALHQQQQQQQQQQQEQQQQSQQGYPYGRRKQNNAYLPPSGATRNSVYHIQQQQTQQSQQQHTQQTQVETNENTVSFHSSSASSSSGQTQSTLQLTQSAGRGPAEGSYTRYPGQAPALPVKQQKQYYNAHGTASATATTTFTKNSGSFSITGYGSRQQQPSHPQQQPAQLQPPHQQQQPPPLPPQRGRQAGGAGAGAGSKTETPASTYGVAPPDNYPERAPGFTRVQAGQGSRTQVHAVLDYDVEEGEEEDEEDDGEYYDAEGHNKDKSKSPMPTVTPIQGPIYLKNGSVPVVPLFSYPKSNNGSFLQIPIWWTALSVALGLDVRGDVIKGVPCIKRYHQLFCPTAGNSYPIDKIERFIDDNKALMRRMYGDFEMNMEGGGGGGGGGGGQAKVRKRRFIDEPDIFIPPGAYAATAGEAGDSYFGELRKKRQAAAGGASNRNRGSVGGGGTSRASNNAPPGNANANSGTGRLDACESKIEIVTPYWASNSAGKIRAIVNTQHFEQAIHQEVCSNTQTSRCEGECGCEQKYKWHRLLAYDPDNDCKGIFMDWFLFPSCCVCRCNP
ncbi:LOW QUALITY PROTEIN: protein spaetzle 3 [Drosophila nasuta]|uniref:LOW QUALITY PROTEIN: protein spaetzle 3 n=1 Tax=Drosophila nasuta TaxID=42062 RepID=UPI00295E2D04|nr:LOW QUALITY PROTEIN: protein spaetzle 3 [Drosophila nasuta]